MFAWFFSDNHWHNALAVHPGGCMLFDIVSLKRLCPTLQMFCINVSLTVSTQGSAGIALPWQCHCGSANQLQLQYSYRLRVIQYLIKSMFRFLWAVYPLTQLDSVSICVGIYISESDISFFISQVHSHVQGICFN